MKPTVKRYVIICSTFILTALLGHGYKEWRV
jgi:hypothetical protein